MITLKSAKKLDKLGILNLKRIGGGGTTYFERHLSIKILLKKLPVLHNNERLSIFKDTNCYEIGYLYQNIRIWHKNLAEALARLLIKLLKENNNGY